MAHTEDYSDMAFSIEDILSEYRNDTGAQDISDVSFDVSEEIFEDESAPLPEINTEDEENDYRPQKKTAKFKNALSGLSLGLKNRVKKKSNETDLDFDEEFDFSSYSSHGKTGVSSIGAASYGVRSQVSQLADVKKELSGEDIDLSQFDAYYTVDRTSSESTDEDSYTVSGASFTRSSYIDLSREEVSSPVVDVEINADDIMNVNEDEEDTDIIDSSLPVQQPDYSGEEQDYKHDESVVTGFLSTITQKFSKKKASREYEEDYLDDDAEDGYGRYSEDDKRFSTSDFKSYLATVSTSISYKLIGMGEAFFTQDEDKEDLGEEVSFKAAQKHYYRHASPLGFRLKIALFLILIMTWISIGLPVTGMLKSNRTATAVCLGMQLVIMLLTLDIITNAITKVFRKIIGFDTLVVIANLITILDSITILSTKAAASHLAINFIAAFSLCGLELSSYLYSRALWKAIRVPGISHKDSSYTVTSEYSKDTHEISLLKSEKPFKSFIRRSEEKSPDENMYCKLSIFILLATTLFTLILVIAKKDFKDIFYFFSLVICPAVPFCGLLCFAVPFFAGTFRLFPKAAAVAGWSGVYDIGHSKNIIITGKDLFPSDHIEISDIKISRNADINKTIAYTGSLMMASGNCLAKPFFDYMHSFGIRTCLVNDFTPLEGGGFKGIIDQQIIYCGSSNFMRLQGIKIPTRKVSRNSILISVNGVIHGVFEINYKPSAEIRESLVNLISSDHHPIFAVKDFNITPEMLREKYDLPTDGYDFPPFVERFEITKPKSDDNSVISAVVCREGLSSFVELTNTVSRIFNTTKFNLYVTIIGSLIASLVVFMTVLISGSISTLALFVIAIVLAAPVLIRSMLIKF